MSRIVWKGSISFGLVTIPVHLHSAIQAHAIDLDILHDKCHTKLKYQRWCPHCEEVVEWQHVVKGIKLESGKYFILTPENLKKLKPEKTDSITISEFIDENALPPIYYSNHYYITPAHERDSKSFFLFLVALQHLKKIAIGTFAMRTKEYVCSIQPYESLLLLSILNYDYEVRSIEALKERKIPKANAKELELAEELMRRLYKKTFSIEEFKDTFFEKIEKQLKAKGKGKKLKASTKKVKAGPTTLLSSLKESLGKHKKGSK